MPKRRRNYAARRRFKRRRLFSSKRSRKGRRRYSGLPRQMRSFTPKVFRTVLKYHDDKDLDPSATSDTYLGHSFAANGCFDPDITGGGHQPMGFDELMTKYQSYHVIKSTITVTFNKFSAAGDPIYHQPLVGIVRREVASALTIIDVNGICEMPGCVYKRGKTGLPVTVKSRYSWSKTHRSKAIDSTNEGTVAANPSDVDYYWVWVGSATNNILQPTVTANIMISYDVLFSDRRDPVMS